MQFFETYALYQIAKGAESYAQFVKHARLATTILNLYEMYYVLCKENQESLADKLFERLLPYCIDVLPEDIKPAAQFRLKHAKLGFSYIDALGYTISLRSGLQFLTGDDAFKNFDQVTFIK
ncbi:PIN domain protein [uncultured archaeon]|nr:PIN domain protein [uncultured archaeon]